MSEKTENSNQAGNTVALNGLFAFKAGMSTLFSDKGEAIPVTVLKYEPWVVTQIKSKEKDGYTAVQLACKPQKLKNSQKSEIARMKAAGFETAASYVKELRQEVPAGLALGAVLSIESLKKGDVVKLTGTSKGHGFTGSQKRWNFAGGPAAHGSKFHRRPGSSGNRTWPGRVMPGKKFPGHYGDERVTVKSVEIVEVMPSENVVIVKGPVPGARHSLVQLVKEA